MLHPPQAGGVELGPLPEDRVPDRLIAMTALEQFDLECRIRVDVSCLAFTTTCGNQDKTGDAGKAGRAKERGHLDRVEESSAREDFDEETEAAAKVRQTGPRWQAAGSRY